MQISSLVSRKHCPALDETYISDTVGVTLQGDEFLWIDDGHIEVLPFIHQKWERSRYSLKAEADIPYLRMLLRI